MGDMTMTAMTKSPILILTCVVLLTGCTSMNIFKDNPEPAAAVQADLPPESGPGGGGMSAAEIKSIISGKSWKWASPKNSGVTLYADDGSSLVEVTGKGTTTGKWQVQDGQLCESFAPAPFLPKGVPMTCQPFTGSGNTYKVGQATFTLA